MTREELMALPPALAVGVLFDAVAVGADLRDVPVPQAPKPPKYDMRVYQKGGFVWASEFALRMLVWWRDRYQESAAGGGQYADKDRKRAESMDRWIAWRICFPSDIWTGTRDDAEVVAKMPSHKPTLHQKDARPAPVDDTVADAQDDDSIPF